MPESIKEWQAVIHNNAIVKGFWEEQRSIPEMLCLIHSEVSECLEVYRGGHEGTIGEELADIVIRVLDMAEGLSIDLQSEMTKKHKFNLTRPRMHGKKI